MNVLNKGLLGTLKQFETRYAKPVEKEGDEVKSKRTKKNNQTILTPENQRRSGQRTSSSHRKNHLLRHDRRASGVL